MNSLQATMQLNLPTTDREALQWAKAAKLECIRFGDHGIDTELKNGHTVCFNCGGRI